jgi:rfaE bifunctional protein nucleotidyltransferase chain/domain
MYLINEKIILDYSLLVYKISEWKSNNETIVFTNGCFDILHLGHVNYLKEAKSLGTKLIVATNSDASVSKLKGKHRPIQNEESRINILAALDAVDAVTIFYEDTPYELITLLSPHVLVKGGDWKVEQIVGSDVVLNNGGKVLSLQFIEGYSTTNIEQKIIEHYKETI